MRRNALRVVQWSFAVLVVVFAGYALATRWNAIEPSLARVRVNWIELSEASLIVLVAYGILIETWRRVLAAWDTQLGWTTAARIWFASSLGKYIPGNIWAIAALGVMARQSGASALAAAGSSVIVNIINLASGLAVVLLFAAQLVPHAAVFTGVAIIVIAGAIATPFILPGLTRLACRVTGREIAIPVIPRSTVWWSLLGTTFAWCAYGVAFRLFAAAVLGDSAVHGGVVLYVAAYTAAYIVGFITLFAPAGIGVREFGIVEGLTHLGLTSQSDAVIVAIVSRLWLTLLEVVPGLVALAAGRTSTRTRTRTA